MDWNNIQQKLANDKRGYARRLSKKIGDYMNSAEYQTTYDAINLQPTTREDLEQTIQLLYDKQGVNLDLSMVDVSNIKDSLEDLFTKHWAYWIKKLDVSGWDLQHASSIRGIFRGLARLETINVTNINVGVGGRNQSLRCLFCEDSSLEEIIGLETWNVSKVIDFSSAFEDCVKLRTVNTSGWKAMVNTMERMFCNCVSLEEIDLAGFDLTYLRNMLRFADGCKQLKSVYFDPQSAEKTTRLAIIDKMFLNCVNLRTIEGFENLNTEDIDDANEAFCNCRKLSLDISNWTLPNADTTSMLKNAKNVICNFDYDDMYEHRNRSFRHKKITESVNSEVISTLDDYVVLLMMMLKGNVKKTPFNADVRGLQKDLVDSMGIKNTVHSNVLDMDIVYDAYFENGNVIIEFNYDRAEYQFVLDGKMVVCTEIF